jgi:small-conductance mechanosensitive channel
MAERSPAREKRSPSAKRVASASVATPAESATLAENTRLKAELAEALERIADLEVKHAELVNRIDRVLDSLHKIVD